MTRKFKVSSEKIEGFFTLCMTCVALSFAFHHDENVASLNCTLLHGNSHPDPLTNCNGKNRSTDKVWDPRSVFNMTAREAFSIIESIQEAKGDCSRAVVQGKKRIPLLNIRFESTAFRDVANVAIRTANMMSDLLTRGACAGDFENPIFRGNPTMDMNDDFLYSIVKSNIQKHNLMFGSGIWFLKDKYKNQTYFAPYAYKKKEDKHLRVKDLSTTWGPAHTDFLPFLESIAKNRTFLCRSSYLTPRKNQSADYHPRHFIHPVSEYTDGLWGRPYFECSTTRAWIVGFFVPFFATRYDRPVDDPIEVMGVASVDIDLSQVDINQCDFDGTSTFTYKIFASTHHCHNSTSKCVHVSGKGFAVGSYKCVCRDGFYFSDVGAEEKFFNGSQVEHSFSAGLLAKDPEMYACKPCRKGCKTCVDDRPCVVEIDESIKYTVLGIIIFCILMVIGVGAFVWRNRELQVVKSASPLFLLITLFGAGLMYTEALVLFMDPSTEVCTAAPWLQHVGFILMYGSLLLKTWRVSLIFKIKQTKRVTVSDFGLLQRLAPLVVTYVVLLVIWTIADNPTSKQYKTKDDLKFMACTENWWNHSLLLLDILLLFWGIHLCYTIRKAPTKFNESKFISWSIYNMTVFMIFMKLMKTFLMEDLGPNITYLLECIRIQLSVTVLVILVFFPKIIRVLKGRGDQAETTSKSRSAGGSSDGTMHLVHENENLKAEITRLYAQLETMKLAKMEAGNRPMYRADSLASGINSPSNTSLSSTRSQSQGLGSPTTAKSLTNGWRNGGHQFFSPSAELVSDFV